MKVRPGHIFFLCMEEGQCPPGGPPHHDSSPSLTAGSHSKDRVHRAVTTFLHVANFYGNGCRESCESFGWAGVSLGPTPSPNQWGS